MIRDATLEHKINTFLSRKFAQHPELPKNKAELETFTNQSLTPSDKRGERHGRPFRSP